MKTYKLFLSLLIALFCTSSIVHAEEPESVLNVTFDTYIQAASATNYYDGYLDAWCKNSGNWSREIISFYNYASVNKATRTKVELSYYLKNATATDVTAQVYALKKVIDRNPSISWGSFYTTNAVSDDDLELAAEILIPSGSAIDTEILIDVTDYMNSIIYSQDSVMFLFRAKEYNAEWHFYQHKNTATNPEMRFYAVKKEASILGGGDLFYGASDSVAIHFPSNSTSPWSVTYTDGTTPVTVTDIMTSPYKFEVSPIVDVTYSIVEAKNANETFAVTGSAAFNVLLPEAKVSGVNTIYDGSTTNVNIELTGTAPWSVTFTDGTTSTTINNVETSPYQLEVTPTSTTTYSVTSATDANSSALTIAGSATITVLPYPIADIADATDWSLIWGDEFGQDEINEEVWSVSNEVVIDESNSEARLILKKDPTAGWQLPSIKMNNYLPNYNDLYVEIRMKPLNGDNISSIIGATNSLPDVAKTKYGDRYDLGILNASQMSDNTYNLYYRLSDWKTQFYLSEIDPNASLLSAADSLMNQSINDYKTYGVEITNNNFRYYIDGVLVKSASDFKGFNDGELLESIKTIATYRDDVGKKTYGYYGQPDWNYFAGYTGDKIALSLSVSNADAFTDVGAEDKYMAVDYIRFYKRNIDVSDTKDENVDFIPSNVSTTSNVANNAIAIDKDGGSAILDLNSNFNLQDDGVFYFSTFIKKEYGSNIRVSLCNDSETTLAGTRVNSVNAVQAGFGASHALYASTVSAEPAKTGNIYYKDGQLYLMVGRVQTSASGLDVISVKLFDMFTSTDEEPYLYPNIDDYDGYGHTSLNNDWDINQKFEAGTGTISKIKFEASGAPAEFQKFTLAKGFKAAVPNESVATILSEFDYIDNGASSDIVVFLRGKAPWEIKYFDGTSEHTISSITEPMYSFEVTPAATSNYSLISVTDADGLSGIASGTCQVKVKSEDAQELMSDQDTYVREGFTIGGSSNAANFNTADFAELKYGPPFNREAFFSFDLTSATFDEVGIAALSLYIETKDKAGDVILDLYQVTGGLPVDGLADLDWDNKPGVVDMKFITSITVNDVVYGGEYYVYSVSSSVNEALKGGLDQIVFAVVPNSRSVGALVKVRQKTETSIANGEQPILALDPEMYDPSAIEEVQAKRSYITTYPNPVVDGSFKFTSHNSSIGEVMIYNAQGIVVKHVINTNNFVDMSDLSSGIYYARFKGQNTDYFKTVIMK